MKPIHFLTMLMLLALALGCSGETAKRLTYESLQTRQQLECQKTPGQQCPERKSYDSYQQKRDEVKSKE